MPHSKCKVPLQAQFTIQLHITKRQLGSRNLFTHHHILLAQGSYLPGSLDLPTWAFLVARACGLVPMAPAEKALAARGVDLGWVDCVCVHVSAEGKI